MNRNRAKHDKVYMYSLYNVLVLCRVYIAYFNKKEKEEHTRIELEPSIIKSICIPYITCNL